MMTQTPSCHDGVRTSYSNWVNVRNPYVGDKRKKYMYEHTDIRTVKIHFLVLVHQAEFRDISRYTFSKTNVEKLLFAWKLCWWFIFSSKVHSWPLTASTTIHVYIDKPILEIFRHTYVFSDPLFGTLRGPLLKKKNPHPFNTVNIGIYGGHFPFISCPKLIINIYV